MQESLIKILIIDDSDVVRKFMRKLLEISFKAYVHECENPKDAFTYLKDNEIDIIILDMQMPIMDGLTALKYLRANPRFVNTPVIACTALSSSNLLVQLGQLKIADYIVKPASTELIIQKVSKVIESFRNSVPKNEEIDQNEPAMQVNSEDSNKDVQIL
ncbi:MAG: response regulator [Candidatus Kapabacteria bacterium]|nr:response regulator [Candidatus Kapabacteria bacterium]